MLSAHIYYDHLTVRSHHRGNQVVVLLIKEAGMEDGTHSLGHLGALWAGSGSKYKRQNAAVIPTLQLTM